MTTSATPMTATTGTTATKCPNDHCYSHRSVRVVGFLLSCAMLLSTSSHSCHGYSLQSSTTLMRSLPRTSSHRSSSAQHHQRTLVSLHATTSTTSTSPLNGGEPLKDPSTSASTTALSSSNAASFDFSQAQDNPKNYQWTKQSLAIALPALMGLLADPVLSMVDTAFVGRIGPMDLAALGVCTSIFHMAFTVFRASTVATTSLVGSAQTDSEKRQITKISLQLASVLGTMVLLCLRFGGPRLLSTMGVAASSPLSRPAKEYLFARCWAAPAVVGSTYYGCIVHCI